MNVQRWFVVFLFLAVFSCAAVIREVGEDVDEQAAKAEWQARLRQYPLPVKHTRIGKTAVYPRQVGDTAVLLDPTSIVRSPEGEIYIADKRFHAVVVIDKAGRHARTIGRKGQGPGDLLTPYRLRLWHKQLVVLETGNNRIQFFDAAGRSCKIIPLFKQYNDFDIAGDGRIFLRRTNIKSSASAACPVDVLDMTGKLLYSLGEIFSEIVRVGSGNIGRIALDEERQEVYVAFTYSPVVARYSYDGKPKGVWRIDHPIIREFAENNRKQNDPKSYRLAPIVQGIQVAGGAVYVLHSIPRYEVLKLSRNGALLDDFWIEIAWNYWGADFWVDAAPRETTIYSIPQKLLEDIRVDVFKPSEGGK